MIVGLRNFHERKEVVPNGDTHRQLLARSCYLLFNNEDKPPWAMRSRQGCFEIKLKKLSKKILVHNNYSIHLQLVTTFKCRL